MADCENNLRPEISRSNVWKCEKSIRKSHSESFLLILCTSILILLLSNGFLINIVDAHEHHTGEFFLPVFCPFPSAAILFFYGIQLCLYNFFCSRFFVSSRQYYIYILYVHNIEFKARVIVEQSITSKMRFM